MVDKEQFLIIGLVVSSSFIHALDGVIVKWISNLTAMEMTFWRMTIQTIILVPVCHYRLEMFWSNNLRTRNKTCCDVNRSSDTDQVEIRTLFQSHGKPRTFTCLVIKSYI